MCRCWKLEHRQLAVDRMESRVAPRMYEVEAVSLHVYVKVTCLEEQQKISSIHPWHGSVGLDGNLNTELQFSPSGTRLKVVRFA
jgi:hypothetical protein